MIFKKTRIRLNYGENIEFTDVFGYIHSGIITYDSGLVILDNFSRYSARDIKKFRVIY
ncbi:MAG: hypothetical protein AMDU4_FER2C00030G0010 [Ferroplasma sp. Type II]|uniref:hypothetical protein n=1 Tax=Ferroplasma sp. Type II TaxID=261388 RepID=UPI0003894B98|nr:hypothetical protein [Ferroplasma sp. Type II]EQB74087.1 MAG: hypothetical protein AMDU4_FER2C00030G0010 [Ferroplasma sp. Type II]